MSQIHTHPHASLDRRVFLIWRHNSLETPPRDSFVSLHSSLSRIIIVIIIISIPLARQTQQMMCVMSINIRPYTHPYVLSSLYYTICVPWVGVRVDSMQTYRWESSAIFIIRDAVNHKHVAPRVLGANGWDRARTTFISSRTQGCCKLSPGIVYAVFKHKQKFADACVRATWTR